ncbi:hypothetical protein Tco_0806746 [Tanacetum coccineum]
MVVVSWCDSGNCGLRGNHYIRPKAGWNHETLGAVDTDNVPTANLMSMQDVNYLSSSEVQECASNNNNNFNDGGSLSMELDHLQSIRSRRWRTNVAIGGKTSEDNLTLAAFACSIKVATRPHLLIDCHACNKVCHIDRILLTDSTIR